MLSLPLVARPGAVIAVGSPADRPDYDYGDGVTLQIYQLAAWERPSRCSAKAMRSR
jgi:hypothetical protein